jgi:hypothetical protein
MRFPAAGNPSSESLNAHRRPHRAALCVINAKAGW